MSDQSDAFKGVHKVTVSLPEGDEPCEGLVVKWRRRDDCWEGLVTHEVAGKITTQWVPALMLEPIEP